jgi:hypothetical protein
MASLQTASRWLNAVWLSLIRFALPFTGYRIKVHGRLPGPQKGRVFEMFLNRQIAEFLKEISLPVPLETRRVNSIEHTL